MPGTTLLAAFSGKVSGTPGETMFIAETAGTKQVLQGQYVVQDDAGRLYPTDQQLFESMFEVIP